MVRLRAGKGKVSTVTRQTYQFTHVGQSQIQGEFADCAMKITAAEEYFRPKVVDNIDPKEYKHFLGKRKDSEATERLPAGCQGG